MSRIGRTPVAVPDGVKVTLADHTVTVEGPLGKLQFEHRPEIDVAFDDAANESAVFAAVVPAGYTYRGLAVELHFSMAAATTGDVDWDVAFERIGDGRQDLDADGFAAAKSADDCAVPARCGNVAVASVELADGAEIDFLGPGDGFRLKVTRDAQSDTATGDAELRFVVVRER